MADMRLGKCVDSLAGISGSGYKLRMVLPGTTHINGSLYTGVIGNISGRWNSQRQVVLRIMDMILTVKRQMSFLMVQTHPSLPQVTCRTKLSTQTLF